LSAPDDHGREAANFDRTWQSVSFAISCPIANKCSVPTKNDIAVPESVLKKQKAHQKTTDSQAAELKKKREV
jgi:hypothetical protein